MFSDEKSGPSERRFQFKTRNKRNNIARQLKRAKTTTQKATTQLNLDPSHDKLYSEDELLTCINEKHSQKRIAKIYENQTSLSMTSYQRNLLKSLPQSGEKEKNVKGGVLDLPSFKCSIDPPRIVEVVESGTFGEMSESADVLIREDDIESNLKIVGRDGSLENMGDVQENDLGFPQNLVLTCGEKMDGYRRGKRVEQNISLISASNSMTREKARFAMRISKKPSELTKKLKIQGRISLRKRVKQNFVRPPNLKLGEIGKRKNVVKVINERNPKSPKFVNSKRLKIEVLKPKRLYKLSRIKISNESNPEKCSMKNVFKLEVSSGENLSNRNQSQSSHHRSNANLSEISFRQLNQDATVFFQESRGFTISEVVRASSGTKSGVKEMREAEFSFVNSERVFAEERTPRVKSLRSKLREMYRMRKKRLMRGVEKPCAAGYGKDIWKGNRYFRKM